MHKFDNKTDDRMNNSITMYLKRKNQSLQKDILIIPHVLIKRSSTTSLLLLNIVCYLFIPTSIKYHFIYLSLNSAKWNKIQHFKKVASP